MALTLEELVVEIKADISDLKAKSHALIEDVRAMGAGVEDAGGGFSRFEAKTVTLNAALELTSKAMNIVGSAVGAFVDFMSGAISEAAEAEVGVAKLNATLQSTGQFSEEFSTELQTIAERLSQVSTATDDEILSVERLLLAFGAGREEIAGLTQSVLDFAAGTGTSLQAASTAFSKALQGQTEALGRYGIQIDATKPKAEQLAQLQAQVQTKFGGQSAAEVNTYAGAVGQVKKSYGELLEEIGGIITKSDDVRALLLTIKEAIDDVREAAGETGGSFNLIGEAIDLAAEAVERFIAVFAGFSFIGEAIARPLTLMAAVGDAMQGDLTALKGAFIDIKERGLFPMSEALVDATGKVQSFQDRLKANLEKIRAAKTETAGLAKETRDVGEASREAASAQSAVVEAWRLTAEAPTNYVERVQAATGATQNFVEASSGAFGALIEPIRNVGKEVETLVVTLSDGSKVKVTLPVSVDTKPAEEQTAEAARRMSGQKIGLELDADTAPAERKASSFKQRTEADDIVPEFDLDTRKAEAKLDALAQRAAAAVKAATEVAARTANKGGQSGFGDSGAIITAADANNVRVFGENMATAAENLAAAKQTALEFRQLASEGDAFGMESLAINAKLFVDSFGDAFDLFSRSTRGGVFAENANNMREAITIYRQIAASAGTDATGLSRTFESVASSVRGLTRDLTSARGQVRGIGDELKRFPSRLSFDIRGRGSPEMPITDMFKQYIPNLIRNIDAAPIAIPTNVDVRGGSSGGGTISGNVSAELDDARMIAEMRSVAGEVRGLRGALGSSRLLEDTVRSRAAASRLVPAR